MILVGKCIILNACIVTANEARPGELPVHLFWFWELVA